jgi:hypothetical protein
MENYKLNNNRDGETLYSNINYTADIKIGIVKAIEDDLGPKDNKGLGRIKVYILGPTSLGGDGDTIDDNLPWCFPMLPKHLSIKPKVGESVLIFVFSKFTQLTDRLYLGPIISQLDKLNKDEKFTSLNGFSFGYSNPNTNINQIPELKGIFPNSEDISIQGRYNTDITQKTNEIVIRAGKFESSTPNSNNPYNFTYNAETQGYIQIKNDFQINENLKGTVTNIVSNKINLITHVDGSPRFNVTNQDNLISDEEMLNILSTAHPIPFGDILLEYLKLLKSAIFNHVHNGSGAPATDLTVDGTIQSIATLRAKAEDLEKSMLSKNVKTN